MSLVALALALLAAASPIEEAKSLYEAGGEAYRRGQYDVAINAFEEAIKLAPRPPIIFSAAQAYRLQYFVDADPKKLVRALELYRRYLIEVPSGGRRDHAAQYVAELAPILERQQAAEGGAAPVGEARLIVSSRVEGATARVDGSEPQTIPATFEAAPGPHTVVVEAPEHASKTIDTVAVAGSAVAVNVELEPLPGRVRLETEEGATVAIGGREVGKSPLEALELSAGTHTLAVVARGRQPWVETVTLARGESRDLRADLSTSGQRIGAYVVFGGAALLLAGAGVSSGLAIDRELAARPFELKLASVGFSSPSEADAYAQLRSERDAFARTAAGFAAAGAGAVITGVLLWLFDTPEIPRAPL